MITSGAGKKNIPMSCRRQSQLIQETEYIHFWNRKLPSGKHTENYGKSQFFMGKFTINGDFP